jgi:hypothetical protein
MRGHDDSATLRALLQLGLFPIEIIAYANGVITKLSGIVPISILHLLLALGFAYFVTKRATFADRGPPG